MHQTTEKASRKSLNQLWRLSTVLTHTQQRSRSSRGASLVEYSLLIALIAVVVIGSLTMFGGQVNENFSVVASEVTG